MPRVLVTGAAGFIGAHVSEALLRRGDRVVGVDAFTGNYPVAIKERAAARLKEHDGFTLVRRDLREPGCCEELVTDAVDVVVHLAASVGVRESLDRPSEYLENNAGVTLRLLEAARKRARAPRVVMASSSSVYGTAPDGPSREDDAAMTPESPYGASKRAAELFAATHHGLYGLDVCCLRLFSVYGPGQRPEMAVHKFTRLLDRGEELPLFGDGSSARDYTWVGDITDGIVRAVDNSRGFATYNLGNSTPVALNELVRKLARLLGREPCLRHLPAQPGDAQITCADITRASEQLGYGPRVGIDEGLERFVHWYREAPST